MKKKLFIMSFILILLSCDKIQTIDLEKEQHFSLLTKSEPVYNASIIDDTGGGGDGQATAYGVFDYPNGWCNVSYEGIQCKVEWIDGVPTVKSFEYNPPFFRYKSSTLLKSAYFTTPEVEISVQVLFVLIDTTHVFPDFHDQFIFKINIPNKQVIISGAPEPITIIDRSYYYDSFSRYYHISFTTDLINSTVSNVSTTLFSHPYLDEPVISYTYTISGNQIVFDISGSYIVERLLPNGSSRLDELFFSDSFAMPL